MKRLLKVALVVLLAFTMFGCTNGGGTEKTVKKVAVLLPYIGDQSYFDTLNNGIERLNKEVEGVEVTLIEVGNTTEKSIWMAAFDEVCEDKAYDLVVSGNNSYEQYLFEACEKYPDQWFMDFDYSSLPEGGCPKNLYAVMYGLDDLGYVVGALSAALSTTKKVGVVVGMDIPAMNQFISGYCQVLAAEGCQYMIYYPGSFQDTALGLEGTKKMIEKGCDVIWQVAGGLGNGVIEACSQNPSVWCVGVDQDQYAQFLDSNKEWAETIITSALKKSDEVLVGVVKMLVDGTLADKMGKNETWGIVENGVGLAENDYYLANCPEAVRAKVTSTLKDVVDGKILVKDCLEFANYDTEWPELRDAGRFE